MISHFEICPLERCGFGKSKCLEVARSDRGKTLPARLSFRILGFETSTNLVSTPAGEGFKETASGDTC